MTELKPCPFCGEEAEIHEPTQLEVEWFVTCIYCTKCGMQKCTPDGKDHTPEEATEAAIEAWNTRAERTCHVKTLPLSEFTEFECSKCCGTIRQLSNYCPHCGAKVVSNNARR